MKIFLDGNLPRKLVEALRAEGHDVESVHTLHLQGLANGKLYEFAKESFDLGFTRDSGFANAVRGASRSTRLRLLRVTLVQKPQDEAVYAEIDSQPRRTEALGASVRKTLTGQRRHQRWFSTTFQTASRVDMEQDRTIGQVVHKTSNMDADEVFADDRRTLAPGQAEVPRRVEGSSEYDACSSQRGNHFS